MPVSMSGMASGVDTDAIISKLVEVERQPIQQLEIDKNKYRIRKEALKQLQVFLEDIDKNAKNLYGFRASFDDKKSISSDTGIIEASATKKAKNGSTSLKVVRMATNHKLATDPINSGEKLPPAVFTLSVNGESVTIRFKGGKLQTLRERIEEEAASMLTSSVIKKTSDLDVLMLESKITGEKGEILISGDKDFLKSIGLVKGEKDESRDAVALVFDRQYFATYAGDKKTGEQNGSIAVSGEGKNIGVKGLLWQDYLLPLSVPVKNDTFLEFGFLYNKEVQQEETIPSRVEMGPEERTVIKGIELKGYNVSRMRKNDEKKLKGDFDSALGIGIVAEVEGKRTEKIYPLEKDTNGKQEIPIGRDFEGKSVTKIIVYCNDGAAEFSDVRIVTPVKGKGLLDPKNAIAKPQDAVINIDGIEITRDKNSGLSDIIDGVTLNLKRSSDSVVTIDVSHDLESSMDKIKKFVESYNKYLEFNAQLIKTEKINKPGEKTREGRGLFVGDMSIVRIESTLRKIVNSAYPSKSEKPVKMFPEIGVSTGEINADWENIKSGKLIVDDAKVQDALKSNPEGVKDFFGSDNDGDNRTDNGMAFTVVNTLKAYIGTGKNIIASKMDLEDENIKLANERIEQHETHVKNYEEKLRKKFSAMEQSISGSKAQQNWLKQQTEQGDK